MAQPLPTSLWVSGWENVIVPAESGTLVTVSPTGRVSSLNGVIVYPPSVAGGAAVPGEPSKPMQEDPEHVICC